MKCVELHKILIQTSFFQNTHNTHLHRTQHIHQTSKEGRLSQGLSQIL